MKTARTLALVTALSAANAFAGEVFIPGFGNGNSLQVESFKERQYRHVVQQQYDFSCGSAAVATLLTYHYQDQTSEADVFQAMYQTGDKQKIRQEGFSMLDMKNYLVDRGYQADGYQLELNKVANIGVPVIVLINTDGYMHFVVIKGIGDDNVLVGDSALGRKIYSRDDFERKWNGIAFLIRNKANISKQRFNLDAEWLVTHRYPLNQPLDSGSAADFLLNLPAPRDF